MIKNITHCKRGHKFTKENTYIQNKSNGRKSRVCKECVRICQRRYDKIHHEEKIQYQRIYRKNLGLKWKEKYGKKQQERFLRKKILVMSHYSPKLTCLCCGENELKFLSIDHINNDGAKHKKENKNLKGGNPMYYWIIKNNFPEGFQVLCMNCNFGKRMNGGICPHKSKELHKIPITLEWQS